MNLLGLRALSSDGSCVLSGKAKSDLELSVLVGDAMLKVQGGTSTELSSRRVREWPEHISIVLLPASFQHPLGVSGHVFRLWFLESEHASHSGSGWTEHVESCISMWSWFCQKSVIKRSMMWPRTWLYIVLFKIIIPNNMRCVVTGSPLPSQKLPHFSLRGRASSHPSPHRGLALFLCKLSSPIFKKSSP